ncbi:unnamed protein product [Rhizophagus irregularis]|nr:unnamed protein product [Rhizophagus irregularis]
MNDKKFYFTNIDFYSVLITSILINNFIIDRPHQKLNRGFHSKKRSHLNKFIRYSGSYINPGLTIADTVFILKTDINSSRVFLLQT